MTTRRSLAGGATGIAQTTSFGLLFILALGADAGANPLYWLNQPKFFICSGLETSPKDNDVDPVYRIDISIETDAQNRVVSFTNTQTSVFGKTFQRTEQYPVETAGLESEASLFWVGKYIKDRSIELYSMISKSSTDRRWYYHEEQFRNGKTRSKIFAGCSAD